MQAQAFFAIPGDLASLTGGYAYDREVMARSRAFGVRIEYLPLPQGFPAPSSDDLRATAQALRTLPQDALLMIDGLAFGAFTPDLLDLLPAKTIALVHHPLAYETGLSQEDARRLRDSERAALAHAAHVIVTSPTTKDLLAADYDVAESQITIALPGTTPASRATGSQGAPHLLAVGSVTPRKGHDVLVEALSALTHLDWRLTIAGSLARASDFSQALVTSVDARGLAARIRFAGEVSDQTLEALYASADAFVMPSLYEGYGMALAEAMARGLPIIATTGGAAAETVPDGAALKVAPGDAGALRDALSRLLTDAEARAQLSEASWSAGQALPSWDDTARIVADALAHIAEGTRA